MESLECTQIRKGTNSLPESWNLNLGRGERFREGGGLRAEPFEFQLESSWFPHSQCSKDHYYYYYYDHYHYHHHYYYCSSNTARLSHKPGEENSLQIKHSWAEESWHRLLSPPQTPHSVCPLLRHSTSATCSFTASHITSEHLLCFCLLSTLSAPGRSHMISTPAPTSVSGKDEACSLCSLCWGQRECKAREKGVAEENYMNSPLELGCSDILMVF